MQTKGKNTRFKTAHILILKNSNKPTHKNNKNTTFKLKYLFCFVVLDIISIRIHRDKSEMVQCDQNDTHDRNHSHLNYRLNRSLQRLKSSWNLILLVLLFLLLLMFLLVFTQFNQSIYFFKFSDLSIYFFLPFLIVHPLGRKGMIFENDS